MRESTSRKYASGLRPLYDPVDVKYYSNGR